MKTQSASLPEYTLVNRNGSLSFSNTKGELASLLESSKLPGTLARNFLRHTEDLFRLQVNGDSSATANGATDDVDRLSKLLLRDIFYLRSSGSDLDALFKTHLAQLQGDNKSFFAEGVSDGNVRMLEDKFKTLCKSSIPEAVQSLIADTLEGCDSVSAAKRFLELMLEASKVGSPRVLVKIDSDLKKDNNGDKRKAYACLFDFTIQRLGIYRPSDSLDDFKTNLINLLKPKTSRDKLLYFLKKLQVGEASAYKFENKQCVELLQAYMNLARASSGRIKHPDQAIVKEHLAELVEKVSDSDASGLEGLITAYGETSLTYLEVINKALKLGE